MSDAYYALKIGKECIDLQFDHFFIAEIGVNHGGSVEEAKRLILSAKRAGADAVKFQSYKAEKLVHSSARSYWDTNLEKSTSQLELFKKYDRLDASDYIELSKFSRDHGIYFSSTPFDLEAVDYLEKIVDFYKIASADITNFPLIEKIASKRKTVILSTGASNIREIEQAVNLINEKSNGESQIVILHCILNYPTQDENCALNMIMGIHRKFQGYLIGLSDHSMPSDKISAISIAYAMGARIFEKHFTLNRNLKGNDHYHSYDEILLSRELVTLRNIQLKLGKHTDKMPLESEFPAIQNARRSIYVSRDLKFGEIINESDLICKRPGYGISPINYRSILNRRLLVDKKSGDLLKWSDFE